jgi:hypothetical protein
MASPLLGIAAVNSLLFTAYGVTRRIISPYPELTMGQIAVAGAGAGAINAVLASPVSFKPFDMADTDSASFRLNCSRSRCRVRLVVHIRSPYSELKSGRSMEEPVTKS